MQSLHGGGGAEPVCCTILALIAAGHAHGGGGTEEDDCGVGGGHSHAAKVAPRMRWREVWLLVAGVLLPLLLNLQGHGH